MERKESWPHLEEDILDERFEWIANNLGVEGKHIVDFNCGLGRAANYLTGYASYWGNDIEPSFIEKCPHELGSFYVLDDTEVVDNVDKADIVFYLGAVIGYMNESSTATNSFLKLIEKTKPESIVFESCREYLTKKGLETKIVGGLRDYRKRIEKYIDAGEMPHLKRKIIIYERIQ